MKPLSKICTLKNKSVDAGRSAFCATKTETIEIKVYLKKGCFLNAKNKTTIYNLYIGNQATTKQDFPNQFSTLRH